MGPDPKTQMNQERTIKLEALRSDIAIAREQARRGELVETTAEASSRAAARSTSAEKTR